MYWYVIRTAKCRQMNNMYFNDITVCFYHFLVCYWSLANTMTTNNLMDCTS